MPVRTILKRLKDRSAAGSIKDAIQPRRADPSRVIHYVHVADLNTWSEPGIRKTLRSPEMLSAQGRAEPVLLQDGRTAVLTTERFKDSNFVTGVERHLSLSASGPSSMRVIVSAAAMQAYCARHDPAAAAVATVQDVGNASEQAELLHSFDEMMEWALQFGATDLHININQSEGVQSEVRFTVDDQYVLPEKFNRPALPASHLEAVMRVVYMNIRGAIGSQLEMDTEQQGSVEMGIQGQRVLARWAGFAAYKGHSSTFRVQKLDRVEHRTLEDLEYLPSHIDIIHRAQTAEGGAIVVSGTTGSGKTTLLATAMMRIPDSRKRMTIEDPVEILMPGVIQGEVSRDPGIAGASAGISPFMAKLLTVKRSNPYAVMVSEIRDVDTGLAFRDLAPTGVNLYTTTHADSAFLVPERLSSTVIGIPLDLLGTPRILKLVAHQALLPKLCRCAVSIADMGQWGGLDALGVPRTPEHWKRYADRFERLFQIPASSLRMRNRDGCPICHAGGRLKELWGVTGRTVVAEMIEPGGDEQMLKLVRNNDVLGLKQHFQSYRTARYDEPDMTGKTLLDCAIYHASLGKLDPRDIEARIQSFESEEIQRINAGQIPKAASIRKPMRKASTRRTLAPTAAGDE